MPASIYQKSELDAQCRQLAEKLQNATQLHPVEIKKEVANIQRDLIKLRDQMIEYLRKSDGSPASGQRHRGLEGINVALSLVVAVEYPVTSVQRSVLKQARESLKNVIEEGVLSPDRTE